LLLFIVCPVAWVGCGRTLQQSQGTFGSPQRTTDDDDDVSWPQNELCQWRIQATHGEKIVLNVTMLDLPDSADCATSYVEVRDGPSIKSPIIGQQSHLSTSSLMTLFVNDTRILWL